MDSVNEVLSALDEGRIIERISFPPEQDVASILDERDSDEFSSRWMDSFNSIEQQKGALDSPLVQCVTAIRESAYLRAYTRWKSSDLAAYISDDFGLIGDAIASGIHDPWVDRLLQSYMNGMIPSRID